MSSKTFTASIDTHDLQKAVMESNKTFTEWAKQAEKTGQAVDGAFQKTKQGYKDAIREQKDFIKGLEDEIKAMKKARDEMVPGQYKSDANREIAAAKRTLSQETAVLTNLQKQSTTANVAEEGSQNNLIKSLGRWGAGLFTLGAALKIGKAILASTEAGAQKFEIVVSQATAGVQFFFRAIASGDWKNFLEGLGKAIKGAREFVEAQERSANLLNEQKVKSSELNIKIAEAREDTFNREDENNEKRKKALTNIIAWTKEKYAGEAVLAKKIYEDNLASAASESKLTEKQIEGFVTQYSSLEKMLTLGKEYNKLKKSFIYQPGFDTFNENIRSQIDAMGEGGKQAGDYVLQIGKIPLEIRKTLADLLTASNEASAKVKIGMRRDEMQLAAVEAEIKKQKEDAAKQAVEDAKISNILKKEEEKLTEAIAKGDMAGADAIATKVANLKKEITAREELARLIVEQSGFEGFVPTVAPTSQLKTPSLIPGKQQKELAKGKSLRPFDMETFKEQMRLQKQYKDFTDEMLEDEYKKRMRIVDAVMELTFGLAETLGMTREQGEALNVAMNATQAMLSGDYIGAALNVLMGVMKLIPSKAEEFAGQIEAINKLLEKQKQLREDSLRHGREEEAIQAELKTLYNKSYLINVEIRRLEEQAGIWNWNKKKDIAEQQAALEANARVIKETQQELADLMAGGTTQNTLANAIAQGFQEGKTSAADFADYMNEVLLNAVMDVFKKEILGEKMDAVATTISESLKNKVLTESEKQIIEAQIAAIAEENQALWDQLTSTLDLGLGTGTQPAGLSGQIARTITEETGTELAGLMRKISDDNRQNRDYNKLSVDHLVGIESNTYNAVVHLQVAVSELKKISTNTAPVYAKDL